MTSDDERARRDADWLRAGAVSHALAIGTNEASPAPDTHRRAAARAAMAMMEERYALGDFLAAAEATAVAEVALQLLTEVGAPRSASHVALSRANEASEALSGAWDGILADGTSASTILTAYAKLAEIAGAD